MTVLMTIVAIIIYLLIGYFVDGILERDAAVWVPNPFIILTWPAAALYSLVATIINKIDGKN